MFSSWVRKRTTCSKPWSLWYQTAFVLLTILILTCFIKPIFISGINLTFPLYWDLLRSIWFQRSRRSFERPGWWYQPYGQIFLSRPSYKTMYVRVFAKSEEPSENVRLRDLARSDPFLKSFFFFLYIKILSEIKNLVLFYYRVYWQAKGILLNVIDSLTSKIAYARNIS